MEQGTSLPLCLPSNVVKPKQKPDGNMIHQCRLHQSASSLSQQVGQRAENRFGEQTAHPKQKDYWNFDVFPKIGNQLLLCILKYTVRIFLIWQKNKLS